MKSRVWRDFQNGKERLRGPNWGQYGPGQIAPHKDCYTKGQTRCELSHPRHLCLEPLTLEQSQANAEQTRVSQYNRDPYNLPDTYYSNPSAYSRHPNTLMDTFLASISVSFSLFFSLLLYVICSSEHKYDMLFLLFPVLPKLQVTHNLSIS